MDSNSSWLINAKDNREITFNSLETSANEKERLDLERAIAESLRESQGATQTPTITNNAEGFEIEDLTSWLEEQDKANQTPVFSRKRSLQQECQSTLEHSGCRSPIERIPSAFLISSPPSELLFATSTETVTATPPRQLIPSDLLNTSPPSPLIFNRQNNDNNRRGLHISSPTLPRESNPFRAVSFSESSVERHATDRQLHQGTELSKSPVNVDQFVESMIVPRRVVAVPKRPRFFSHQKTPLSLTKSNSAECPLCGCYFSFSRIERHASDCTGTVSDRESDEDNTLGKAYLSSPTRPKSYSKPKLLKLEDWDEPNPERSPYFPFDKEDEKTDCKTTTCEKHPQFKKSP